MSAFSRRTSIIIRRLHDDDFEGWVPRSGCSSSPPPFAFAFPELGAAPYPFGGGIVHSVIQ